MKKLSLIASTFLLFGIYSSFAQQVNPHDGTQSVHNYKHPNKAAKDQPAGIVFRAGRKKAQTIADVKEAQRKGGRIEAASIAVPARDVAAPVTNYKQPVPQVRKRDNPSSVTENSGN